MKVKTITVAGGALARKSDDGSVDSWIGSVIAAVAFIAGGILGALALVVLVVSHIQWR